MTRKVKKNFINHVSSKEVSKLPCKGYTGRGPNIGKQWHSAIKHYINENNYSSDNDVDENIAKGVIDTVKDVFPNQFEFLKSEFALFGYMTQSDISYWDGIADAIGFYEGNYVIVDWKVVQPENFKRQNPDVYGGSYLHQCLVYARLLQLHLNLEKLPFIMIVLINNENGEEIHPHMIETYPDECTKLLESYNWFVNKPTFTPPTRIEVHCGNLIKPKSSFIQQGVVDDETQLCQLFKKNAKVSDLRKAFGIPPFHLVNH